MFAPIQDLPNLNMDESKAVNMCHIVASHAGCKVSCVVGGGSRDMKKYPFVQMEV